MCGPLAGIETPNGGAIEVATVKRGAMLRAGLGVGVGFDAAQAERLPADNADALMRHKAPLLVGRVGGPLDGRTTIWYGTPVLRLPRLGACGLQRFRAFNYAPLGAVYFQYKYIPALCIASTGHNSVRGLWPPQFPPNFPAGARRPGTFVCTGASLRLQP